MAEGSSAPRNIKNTQLHEIHIYILPWCLSRLWSSEVKADQEEKAALHHFSSLSLGILVQNRNWNHQFHLSSQGDHGVTAVPCLLSSLPSLLPRSVLLPLGIPLFQDCVMACAMCRFRYFLCHWAQASISIITMFLFITTSFLIKFLKISSCLSALGLGFFPRSETMCFTAGV